MSDNVTPPIPGKSPESRRGAGTIVQAMKDFTHMEASGGIVLVIAAIAALIIANTPLNVYYDYFLNQVDFRIGFVADNGYLFGIQKSVLHWINDGLMALFFFLIGLEVKREFVKGELSSRDRAILPAIAAFGGMAVPALIFLMVNRYSPETTVGWAIPAATDIAFALGVLSLLGSRVPLSLKVLLTAIAVMDDLGAIVIIALFYSHDIHIIPIYVAVVAMVTLVILNRNNVTNIGPYILVGLLFWAAVLQSGVHATLAGVITALFIPLQKRGDPSVKPCEKLEHILHPWVAFMVLPIFGFANAGVPFAGIGPSDLLQPLTLGIILGLLLGKQIGIFTMLWATIKLGLSPMPKGASWQQLYAMSTLCGIGFTMSLFIGGLAFSDVEYQAEIRMGVLTASVISATIGYLLLRSTPRKIELSGTTAVGKMLNANQENTNLKIKA